MRRSWVRFLVCALVPAAGALGGRCAAADDAGGSGPSEAGGVQLASDGANVWVAHRITQRNTQGETSEKTLLLHRGPGDDPDALLKVYPEALTGRLAADGLAAAAGRLELVFDNLKVRQVKLADHPTFVGRAVDEPQTRPGLDEPGTTLKAFAVDENYLWALVHVTDSRALKVFDAPAPTEELPGDDGPADESDDGSAEPPEAAAPGDASSSDAPAGDASATSDAGDDVNSEIAGDVGTIKLPSSPGLGEPAAETIELVSVDRLLRLVGRRWVKVDLPGDWVDGSEARMVLTGRGDGRPVLLVPPSAASDMLTIYRPTADGWQLGELPMGPSDAVQAVVIDGQIVVAARRSDLAALLIEVHVVLPDKLSEPEQMRVPGAAGHGWQLIAVDGMHPITVASWSPDNALTFTQMDLHGQSTESAGLRQKLPSLWPMFDDFLFITVLSLATLMMFIFWRRDPQWNRLELPESMSLANLPRRAGAAAIDMAPSALLMIFVFRITPGDMPAYWIGWLQGGWPQMQAGVAAISLYTAHCCLFELFTARTLGKAMLGLRVTTLSGQPPNVWQVIVRNLAKALELVPVVLLILPLFSPNRQRLGDMVARTVVVMDARSKQDETKES